MLGIAIIGIVVIGHLKHLLQCILKGHFGLASSLALQVLLDALQSFGNIGDGASLCQFFELHQLQARVAILYVWHHAVDETDRCGHLGTQITALTLVRLLVVQFLLLG